MKSFIQLISLLLCLQVMLYSQEYEEEEFSPYEGKYIKSISIVLLDVGGPSINGIGNGSDTTWFGEVANLFHIKTKEWVVKQRLLFGVGDKVNRSNLNESERLLRNSGPFNDANIEVVPPDDIFQDSVDIVVITKDKWTLTLMLSYNADKKNSYFGIKDENIAGLGHSVNAQVSYDQDKSVGVGSDINYLARNILGSFTDAELNIHNDRRTQTKYLSFSRPFYSTETDYAGGLNIHFQNNRIDYYDLYGHPVSTEYKNSSQDVWIGKAFALGFGPDYFRHRSKIIAALRFAHKKFTNRPEVTSTYNRLFENSTMLLFSLGFINQRFYKDHYIESFGITEDVPIGGIFNLTAGSEQREFSSRSYFGLETIFSRRVDKIGYFSGKFAFGGFNNDKKWEQNTINFNLIYHTPVIRYDRWAFRGVLNNDFTLGYNRFIGEELYLHNEYGIRGIDKFLVYGTKAGILNLEARIFSPYSLVGFKFGALVFADLGVINSRRKNVLDGPVYQSFGFGLRTRNELITRAEFVINFIYTPRQPDNSKGSFSVLLKSSIALGIRNFGIDKPSVLSYSENK